MKKHISYRSAELLQALNKQNQSFFTIKDAIDILSNSNEEAVRRLLINMAQKGLIFRIKDGLYNIIPYEKEVDEYFPNWHQAAEKLVMPEKYYIGFYSALDIHELITQPSLVEQIVTVKQFYPKTRIIGKVKFEHITYPKKRFFGFKKVWISDFDKIYCSDIEKTIIDCIYKPNYASGIDEIVKAIYRAKDDIDPEKLIRYIDLFDTEVVNKRMGFILENLKILETVSKEIRMKIKNSYAPLDPSLPREGKYISRWKILDNVGIQTAIQSIKT